MSEDLVIRSGQRTSGVLGVTRFLLPFVLTLAAYDLQRLYLPWVRGEILLGSLYELERKLFGVDTGGRLITPNEWLGQHLHPVLDFVTGAAYLLFIPQFLAVSAYFRFALPRQRPPGQGPAIRAAAERMAWAFLAVNILGYVTYVILPAAPPWFVAERGFGPPDLSVPASPAGAARFDALLGVTLFQKMYAQSTNVFGALPSLHVAYPTIAAIFAFKLRSLRGFCIGFTLLISFSAVYLNHHYVLDVALGAFYGCLTGFALARRRNGDA